MNTEIKLKDTNSFCKFEQQKREQKRREMAENWNIASEMKEVPKRWASTEFDNL